MNAPDASKTPLLLRGLFLLNALVTAVSAIVLFCDPQRITRSVGLNLPQDPTILSDLLGASELSVAAVCIFAARAQSPETVRGACWAVFVFHFASALAGLRSYFLGVIPSILWSVAAHVAMFVVSGWFAVRHRATRGGDVEHALAQGVVDAKLRA